MGADIWSLRVNLGPLGAYVGHIGVKFEPLGVDFRALGVDIWSLRVNLGPLAGCRFWASWESNLGLWELIFDL